MMIGSFVQLMAAILFAPFASEEDKRRLAEEEQIRRERQDQFRAISRLCTPDAAAFARTLEMIRDRGKTAGSAE